MRINKNIPNYLLQGDGVIVNMLTGELEQRINKLEYRLETSETVYLETKGKTIKLVRRFTDEQIKKLYEQGETYKEVSKKPEKTKVTDSSKVDLKPLNKDLTNRDELTNVTNDELTNGDEYKFVINNQKFVTIQHAIDALSMSRSTIERRLKSDDFPTYYKVE